MTAVKKVGEKPNLSPQTRFLLQFKSLSHESPMFCSGFDKFSITLVSKAAAKSQQFVVSFYLSAQASGAPFKFEKGPILMFQRGHFNY